MLWQKENGQQRYMYDRLRLTVKADTFLQWMAD